VALSSFAAFALIEHEALTPEKAFTAIALFVSFRLPLMMLPRMFQLFFQAKVSIDRLEDFLQLEELKNVDHAFSSTQEHFPSKTSDGKPFGMQDVSFILSDEAMSNASMENITINIPKGKLTVIVGAVGSGKSVLLSGLIGETEPIKGLVPRTRSIAYASQEVYIINATIRGINSIVNL
jgi:ABC-type multidrug transport system fused ATPase/permease subunit